MHATSVGQNSIGGVMEHVWNKFIVEQEQKRKFYCMFKIIADLNRKNEIYNRRIDFNFVNLITRKDLCIFEWKTAIFIAISMAQYPVYVDARVLTRVFCVILYLEAFLRYLIMV